MSNQIGGGESQGSSQRQRSKTRGYGVHLDLNTGQTTLNPGMANEVVVSLGENTSQTSMVIDVDPQTRYPIPNERELKNKDKHHAPCSASATRKIKFVGDGLEVTPATNLPFKAPGLQWMGGPSITLSQLQREGNKLVMRQKMDKTTGGL
ncbi:hypothetical protein C2S52_018386 [Perilla frutescens var. hirtella]|nr:hypothetical protein C2S52_018386 [Perilla frutescens var. hirtella]